MLLLAFDTTANSVSVALYDGTEIVAHKYAEMTRGQGEALIPMIADTMAAAGRTMAALTHIAVAVGPGSFTGVRVGLAAARGLGLALGIPVLGVMTFEVAALDLPRPLTVILDTKRGDFYTQFFPENGEVVEPQIQTLDVVSNLSGCITGDGVMLFSGKGTVVRHEMAPAEAVARIAASRLDHPLPPEPVYLRDADVSC